MQTSKRAAQSEPGERNTEQGNNSAKGHREATPRSDTAKQNGKVERQSGTAKWNGKAKRQSETAKWNGKVERQSGTAKPNGRAKHTAKRKHRKTKTPLRFYSRAVFKLLSEVPLAKGTVFHHERIRCLRGAGSLATVSDSAVCRFRKAPRLNALNLLVCAHRLCN